MFRFFRFIYSAISSINVAYMRTESTPPSLICMFLRLSCVVFNFYFEVGVYYLALTSVHSPLFTTCSSASHHALSDTFVTSRNTMYVGFFFVFWPDMFSISITRWSLVALPSLSPSLSPVCYLWSCTVMYYSFVYYSMLLEIVITLSLEHVPFFRYPCTVGLLLPISVIFCYSCVLSL